MYAERKEIPLDAIEIRLEHGRVHTDDCEDCESEGGLIDEIHGKIRLDGDLDEAQRERLMYIATRCPVHRTLTTETKIRLSEA